MLGLTNLEGETELTLHASTICKRASGSEPLSTFTYELRNDGEILATGQLTLDEPPPVGSVMRVGDTLAQVKRVDLLGLGNTRIVLEAL